jgi:hypothetical protein
MELAQTDAFSASASVSLEETTVRAAQASAEACVLIIRMRAVCNRRIAAGDEVRVWVQ